MDALEIGVDPLRPRAVALAARSGLAVRLHPAAWERIVAGHEALGRLIVSGDAIYGVSTGLGAVADTRIAPDGDGVQRRVVLGRMVGVGARASAEQVRAVMLARLAGFAEGRSGASPEIVAAYIGLLNAGVIPVMPLIGSVGEADLAPLAHIAGVLAGAGEALIDGETLSGPEALDRAELVPPPFGVKDGLALVSSNAVATGLGALILADAERLFGAWLAAAALSFEGYRANLAPLQPQAAVLRPAPGQSEVAAALLGLFEGSDLIQPGAARKLQDPLSFRCVVPVLGACLAALRAATAAVELELNSSADNPAIIAAEGAAEDAVQPNANFDTTHLALAFETLALAAARVASAQAARILRLMSAESSGLPRFLCSAQDGRSGLAGVQKTVAALVAEIGQRSVPMPIWSVPAADGVEDYATMVVSTMGKIAELLERLRLLCAIELLVAGQACDLRSEPRLGLGAAAVRRAVRGTVTMLLDDRPIAPDIEALDALIASGLFDDFAAGMFR
jgi:histidine ammonia-lyase